MKVAEEFKLFKETIHITVNLIDRFLSKVPSISSDKLQLIAITSILISTKLEVINN